MSFTINRNTSIKNSAATDNDIAVRGTGFQFIWQGYRGSGFCVKKAADIWHDRAYGAALQRGGKQSFACEDLLKGKSDAVGCMLNTRRQGIRILQPAFVAKPDLDGRVSYVGKQKSLHDTPP